MEKETFYLGQSAGRWHGERNLPPKVGQVRFSESENSTIKITGKEKDGYFRFRYIDMYDNKLRGNSACISPKGLAENFTVVITKKWNT